MSTRLMTHRYEAILRLVHARRRTTTAELLTLYRSAPLTPKSLHSILDELQNHGWVCKVPNPHGRANGIAWIVAEEALPHLLKPARLPLHPGTAPQRTRAPQAGAVTPPTYRASFAPYVPPPAPAIRPGALDFLRHPSHGACR